MRKIPSDMLAKINNPNNTIANNTQLSQVITVSRPISQFRDDTYVEEQLMKTGNVTDCDIAVSHTKLNGPNSSIYVAYITNGIAKVVMTPAHTSIDRHNWIDVGFSEIATKVSIAFNGTIPIRPDGTAEFVSDRYPWIFWINTEGTLKSLYLDGKSEPITLANTNAVDVSCIRGVETGTEDFDYGFCCFFVLANTMFYRQFSKGVWHDAIPVSPPSIALARNEGFASISTFKTTDYRIGLSVKTSLGKVYEIFSEYQGFGKNCTEYVRGKVSPKINVGYTMYYAKDYEVEHETEYVTGAINRPVSFSVSSEEGPIYIKEIVNRSKAGDYGKELVIKGLTYRHFDLVTTKQNLTNFRLFDANGDLFIPNDAVYDECRNLVLIFNNFNNAVSPCSLRYIGTEVLTAYGDPIDKFEVSVRLTGLIPYVDSSARVITITNE